MTKLTKKEIELLRELIENAIDEMDMDKLDTINELKRIDTKLSKIA